MNGQHFHLSAAPATQGADPVAPQLTTALNNADWPTVYALADDALRADMSATEVTTWIQGKLESGHIDQVRITGDTTYFTSAAGSSYARVPVHEEVTVAGQAQSADATLVLICDTGTWRWLTTK